MKRQCIIFHKKVKLYPGCSMSAERQVSDKNNGGQAATKRIRMKRRFLRDKFSVVSVLLDRFKAGFQKRQRKISDWLNHKCEHFSPRQLTVGLVIFCIVFGCSFFFTIWNSLESYGSKRMSMQMTIPKHVIVKDSSDAGISEMIILQKIYRQLDSLRTSKNGSQALDSLRKFRPGLLDSLKAMQHIYQSKFSEHEK